MAYEPHRFCAGFALAHVHSGYLGYDFPTFLNIEHIVLMDAEGVDYILVVQRCAFHHSSRQKHRVEIGHGCHHTHASDFERHMLQARQGAFRLELIGYGPAGRF